MDTLTLVLFGLVCFYIGWAAHRFVFKHTVIPVLKELGITEDKLKELLLKVKDQQTNPKQEDTRPEISIKIEEYEGLLYAYRRDNHQYLCRAKTADLLREELAEVLPTGFKITVFKNEGAEYFN